MSYAILLDMEHDPHSSNQNDTNPAEDTLDWTSLPGSTPMQERRVARRWNKSIRTLQRWRSEGYGPPFLRIGGTIHYRVSDILAFEARQRRGGKEV
jgi:hypothetical protein